MATHITTQELRQGSAGFLLRLDFTLKGFTDTYLGQTWRVKIVCPDGTILSKTTGIEFLENLPKISVPIVDFDLILAGTYFYQVTLLTGGANINSEVGSFEIEPSLPEGLPYSVVSSAMNYFPIFTSGGALAQSNLRVDEDTDLNYAGGAKFNGDVTIDTKFRYNSTTGALKLQDTNYVPFAGSLNADVLFSVGSNDNVQNNAGLITTSNHFVGSATDLKITASGADKWYTGSFIQLRTGGSYTGSGYIIGQRIYVNNRLQAGAATPYVNGQDISINLEGNATEAVGMVVTSYKGSTVSCPKFVGVRATAANGYTNADELTGVESIVRTVSIGATATITKSFWSRYQITAGHTITEARGLSIDSWTNGGTIENSYGIYADNSINIGTQSSYFIYSLAQSPSLFTGHIMVPNDAYDAGTWDNNFTVPTKNALRDKFESFFSAGVPILGGGANRILYQDASGNLATNTNFTYNSGLLFTRKLSLGDPIAWTDTGTENTIYVSIDAYPSSTTNGRAYQMIRYELNYNGTGTGANLTGFAGYVRTGPNAGALGTVVAGDFTAAPQSSGQGAANSLGIRAISGAFNVGGTVTNSNIVQATLASYNASAVTTGAIFRGLLQHLGSGNFGTVYGLNLSGWTSAPVTNSYGIYMDATIDRGSALKYAIYSLSTSPSVLTGGLTVNSADGLAVTGNGKLTVTGVEPYIELTNTEGGGQIYRFRNGIINNADLDIFNATTSTSLIRIETEGSGSFGKLGIATSAIPLETTVWISNGHTSGTNVDIRNTSPNYSSTLDVQMDTYDTDFRSAYIQVAGNSVSNVVKYLTGIDAAGRGTLCFSDMDGVIRTIGNFDLIFGTNFTERMRITGAGVVKYSYDASNYLSITIGSTGTVTFNAVGAGAGFAFSDAVNVPTDAFDSTWNGSTEVPTKGDLYPLLPSGYEQTSNDVRKKVVFFDDLINPPGFPTDGWAISATQAGMVNGLTPDMSLYPSAVGVISLRFNTVSTNAFSIIQPQAITSSVASAGRLGGGLNVFTYKFSTTKLSDGTDTYTLYVGVANGGNTVTATRGCFFRYTHSVNGGKWEAVCVDSSGETATDTGVTVTASTTMKTYEVRVNAAATEAKFYIDGTLVATVTTNIPTGSTDVLGGMWSIRRSAGTSATTEICALDYVRAEWNFTTPR